jgi:uncharacterized membrane protein
MNLPDGLLPAVWLWSGGGVYAVLLFAALRRAPWKRLADGVRLNLFLGMSVALMVMWSLKAGVLPGLNFHYLGATLLTLIFGWPLAVIALSLVLVASTLNGASGWQAFPVNALVMGMLPAGVTWLVFRFMDRFLPKNLFIYIFVCGFFGAALGMAATGLASTVLYVVSGVYGLDDLLSHYLPYYLLMVFPEAIITGSLVALLVVYHPQWVATYDEDAYLR